MSAIGLLLAGGSSRRLGQDKALLAVASGQSLLAQSAFLLQDTCTHLCWAPGQRQDLSAPPEWIRVEDDPGIPGPASPLLRFAAERLPEFAQATGLLLMALDQPCLELSHLHLLMAQEESVLAEGSDGRAALPAWVRFEDLAKLSAEPTTQPRLMATLQSVCRRRVTLPTASCGLPATFNLNTPDDLQRYREHCRAPGHDPAC